MSDSADLIKYLTGITELRRRHIALGSDDMYALEEYVLKYGRLWNPPPKALPRGVDPMESKFCFDNAYELAERRHKTLRYVEGFASRFITVHHAWCVTADGTVVDPTWKNEGTAYYGQAFTLAQVKTVREGDHGNASVLMDWPHNYPLLMKKEKVEK